MKIKVRAKVTAEVEKTIDAGSIEDGLAKARKLRFKDLLWAASGTARFTGREKVEIKGVES